MELTSHKPAEVSIKGKIATNWNWKAGNYYFLRVLVIAFFFSLSEWRGLDSLEISLLIPSLLSSLFSLFFAGGGAARSDALKKRAKMCAPKIRSRRRAETPHQDDVMWRRFDLLHKTAIIRRSTAMFAGTKFMWILNCQWIRFLRVANVVLLNPCCKLIALKCIRISYTASIRTAATVSAANPCNQSCWSRKSFCHKKKVMELCGAEVWCICGVATKTTHKTACL